MVAVADPSPETDESRANGTFSDVSVVATRSVTDLMREHLPLFVGILSALFIAIRILSEAGFDPETAYAIIQAGGAGSIISSAALSSVGYIAFLIFQIGAGRLISHPETSLAERHVTLAVVVVSGVVSIFTTPAAMILLLLILVLLYFLVGYILQPAYKFIFGRPTYEDERNAIRDALLTHDPNMMRRVFGDPRKRQASAARFTRIAVSLMSLGVATYAVLSPPWMPAEELSIKNSQPVVGYVVSSNSDEFTILTIGARQVRFIRSSLITDRRICYAGGFPLPLLDFSTRYAQCTP